MILLRRVARQEEGDIILFVSDFKGIQDSC